MVVTVLLKRGSMSNYTGSETDRTLGQIIKDLTSDLSTLVRSEIALLKLELRQSLAKLGGGSALLAAALFFALIGVAFLFVTFTLGLVALGVPAWVSALIITVVLFIGAVVLALAGKKKLQAVSLPTESVEHMKTDIETLKADFSRARSR